MGRGGCTSLCSAVNSCTPLQGLITQVSLEIPATKTPGGRGAGKKKNQAQCVPCLRRAPPQIIILKNIFTGKNLFHSFIKDVPRYISQRGVIAEVPAEAVASTQGKDYVTDKRLSSKIHRWQLSWISIGVHIASISYFIFTPPPIFHFKQQVGPDWMIPNLSCPYKNHRSTHCFPIIFYYPSSKHIKIRIRWRVHARWHLGQMSIQLMKW